MILLKCRVIFVLSSVKFPIPAVIAVFHGDVVPDFRISSLLALLRLTALFPSRCSEENLLGLLGFDGELVVGASAFAVSFLSGVRLRVVKNQEVRPAPAIDVVVYMGHIETFFEVVDRYEVFAIICDH